MAQDISWESFQSHLLSTIRKLYTEHSYADVTLVCDDLIQIPAHKFVLSACSPKLDNILINNPHSHPLLYMRGVNQQELQSIHQFMYLGQVKIKQETIEKFLEIAQDIQIEGFMHHFRSC